MEAGVTVLPTSSKSKDKRSGIWAWTFAGEAVGIERRWIKVHVGIVSHCPNVRDHGSPYQDHISKHVT